MSWLPHNRSRWFLVGGFGQQPILRRNLLRAAGTVGAAFGGIVLKGGLRSRQAPIDCGLGLSKVSFADRDAIERNDVAALVVWARLGPKVVFEVFPIVAPPEIGAEGPARVIAAVDHAVLAARVTRDSIDDAVFVPRSEEHTSELQSRQ